MLPVKYHLNDNLMPDKATQEQLEALAKEKNIISHVAVMPDVHSKKGRKCPTGTVACSSQNIFPQILDTAPNCGMRLIATPWGQDDLTEKRIDDLFQELVKQVPTRTYVGDIISKKAVIEICQKGAQGLLEYLKEDLGQLNNIYKHGNFFDKTPAEKEILSAVPKIFLRAAQFRLGILGEAGNHFLDLMKVDKIHDKEKAKAFGISENQYVFLMHTGSGIFGQYASYFFTPKKEEHLSMKIITNLGRMTFSSDKISRNDIEELQKEVKKYRSQEEFYQIDPETNLGQTYLTAHYAAANYGFANRVMIERNLKKSAQKILGLSAKSANFKLVCDMPHVFVNKETRLGKELWVHRNGATSGYGPSLMKDHPVFSRTGEPGIIAGSMSTPSYLVTGTDQNDSTFYSINHGAGRTKNIDKEAPKNKEELRRLMKKSQVKLYNAQSKGVVNQAGKYYKDIEEILQVAQDFRIAEPVARLQPVAVLMA